MSQTEPSPLNDISDTIRTNFVGFASFTILVWDHVITFSDEVEYIWKGKKGPSTLSHFLLIVRVILNVPAVIYLFIFNRYFTPLGFIINLFAYLSPSWTVEVRQNSVFIGSNGLPISSSSAQRCTHFIRYEGCTVAIAVEVVGLMMLLRINALYPRQRWISALLAFLLIVETAINAWLISRGEPVLHNRSSGVHACSMVFDPAISNAASASAWYPLLYDSIVFGLTVNRTLPAIRKKQAGFIVKKLLEDGLLYYSVIFSITFVLTFMIVGAPPGTKNICAQMEQLLTVAMMSRITLSLKRAGRRGEIIPTPFLLNARNPDFSDTFSLSVVDSPLDDLAPPHGADGLKQPDRLILHGRSPITFAVPPSSQPSHMSEPFAFPSAKACPPLRASINDDV
ncbi:hypothetical protein MVEN_00423300 [Mycena venus]|uniref:DUF6533 domain-containing protein n=1 Tax=Mycena venus TaxID=2733690 RepID=A0A8H7DB16_9AGAR|nr:hypothetical protein MVEN_00423300 [Mycena venus]